MTSLHQVVEGTKKFLAISAGAIIGLILIAVLVNIGNSLKETFFPTPPPPPTVSFGKLPSITFPQNATAAAEFTYTLNTNSGTLPTFGDRATVYKLQQQQPTLLILPKLQTIATQVGFTDNPTTPSETTYQWTAATPFPMKLTINSLSLDFHMTADYIHNSNVIAATAIPTQSNAVQIATNYFSNAGIFPTDIDQTKTQTTLFSVTNGTLTPASSFSQAQIVRVDFYQQNVNNLPIYYPHPMNSPMYAIIASGANQAQIVEAEMVHKTILSDFNGTYPLKTTAQAFDDLKNGNAYIASYSGTGQTITIQNVFLAYYLGEDPEQYLMPIIVFQGNDNFYAYVSAITDAELSK